MFVTSSGKFQ